MMRYAVPFWAALLLTFSTVGCSKAEDAAAHVTRGFADWKKAEMDNAIEEFTEAIRVDPVLRFKAYYNLRHLLPSRNACGTGYRVLHCTQSRAAVHSLSRTSHCPAHVPAQRKA